MPRFTKAQKEKYLKEYEELMQKKYGGIAQVKLEQAKGIIKDLCGMVRELNNPNVQLTDVDYSLSRAEAFLNKEVEK